MHASITGAQLGASGVAFHTDRRARPMLSPRVLIASGTFALLLITSSLPAFQSGRGLMHGYVAFEDLSYNEVEQGAIRAKIELRGSTEFNHAVYTAETDRRGAYDIPTIAMGEYTLRISAPGHAPYQIELYIPSDFECRLAVMLKKSRSGTGAGPTGP